MQPQTRAYFYAGLTILFWSTVATAFKLGLQGVSPAELLFWSTLTSLVLLAIIGFIQNKNKGLFRFTLKEAFFSAILGFLNPFFYYLILFKAYSLLPAQVAQPLNMIWPIVLVFLSVPILKTRVPLRTYAALFVCLVGVYLISSRGHLSDFKLDEPLGLFLSLGSSIIWSVFWLMNVKDKRDEVQKLFLNFLFALLYLILYFAITGSFRIPSGRYLIAGIYVGIFEMGLSFVFWLKALRYSRSPDQISSLMYLFPFISLIFIHFILGEQIFSTTFAGLFFIVAGIFWHKFRLFTNKSV